MIAVAMAILCLDGWPVVFRQKRIGRHGLPFRILKFRTMTNRLMEGSTITVAGDARVTALGKWLRRFKLDELPQLINVLRGEMSFVGPRPDVPSYLDHFSGSAARLLELRPGITGPATLAFKNEEALLGSVPDPKAYNDEVIFPEKIRMNLEYLNSMSLAGDLRCIVATVLPSNAAALRFEKLSASNGAGSPADERLRPEDESD